MIMANCDRDISFTMAASSFSKPIVGDAAKALKAIPIYRPEDSKKKGSGKLKFISTTEIQGNGTKFLDDYNSLFKTGISALLILNKTFVIDKVIDNEKMTVKEIKEDAEALMGKEHDYFFSPKILFKSAYQRLAENGCICIFPEGTSHDRTEFLKLKAGIALMTLGAMAEHDCKPVKICPVGLNYFKRDEFRSEVVIEFGTPFEVPLEWASEYKTNKRHATEKLLVEIEAVNKIC
jgi:glycerol-3-phosphate O-acyltransferase/dihydroxyacetone phosphate acyltransferase